MKWLVMTLLAAFALYLFYLQPRSVKTSYVNGLAPYTNLPGRSYILQQDCYIFKLKHRGSDWPFLGSHQAVGDLPEAVSESKVGTESGDARILGVLRVGERFRIASVRRDMGPSSTVISFEVTLPDEATRRYPRLDAYFIMDHSGDNAGTAPSILGSFAVPIGKE